MKLILRRLLGLILTLVVAIYSFQIIKESNERQKIVIENAELKNIKYGLLSVYSWRDQITNIISKKVKEFELTDENRRELRSHIQNGMYKLLDEVEEILKENQKEGNLLQRGFTILFQSLVFNVNDLRRKVPEFTEIILSELDNYETREQLREYIQNKVNEVLYETIGDEDLSKIKFIENKYNCSNIEDCGIFLHSKLKEADKKLTQKSLTIIELSFFTFILLLFKNKDAETTEYTILIALCGILLYTGINTPMIDIDARIENFNFSLMGEPIEFNDQILFFQSKSILDVANILIHTREFQSAIVGGLIFLFSIIFPISKLIASLSVINKRSLYENKIINFLALKSGKWSMADVMVAAIFMSYIGFNGVIKNQLLQLQSISEKVDILTTNNSNFGVGFILFLAFCLGSLFLSSELERKKKL